MRKSILVTSAAALLSVAAATVATTADPGIDWPAEPSVRVVGAGQGDGIDWPAGPTAPTGTRDGGTGVIDWP